MLTVVLVAELIGYAFEYQQRTAFVSAHETRRKVYTKMRDKIVLEMKNPGREGKIVCIAGAPDSLPGRVLDLAKWESGEFSVSMCLVSLQRLFKRIAACAITRNALVEGLDGVATTIHVYTDEYLLYQAAANVISNGDTFRQGKDLVVVLGFEKSNDDKGTIVVVVRDYGKGMPGTQQLETSRIPAKHADAGDTSTAGTGLGLSLGRAIIESGLRGSLVLTSEGLGMGTTATIRVPVKCQDEPESPKSCPDMLWWVKAQAAGTVDTLASSDSKLDRMSVVRAAKKLALSSHEAADDTEALERIRQDKYSVILMDYQMLSMTCSHAVEKACQEGYEFPIVTMSAAEFDKRAKVLLSRRDVAACLNKIAVPGPRQVSTRVAEVKENWTNAETQSMESSATGDAVSGSGGSARSLQMSKRSGHDVAGPPKKISRAQ